MSKLIMMVGLPASGKSTWIKNNLPERGYFVIGVDAYIEDYADKMGLTYNDVYDSKVDEASRVMLHSSSLCFSANKEIVWDERNLTKKVRMDRLKSVPKHYKKTAVFIYPPEENEYDLRLQKGKWKSIPHNVINGMMRSIQVPSLEEGFDEIIIVGEPNA